MKPSSYQSRRGSIYLITLITVAAIVSMVYVGVAIRSSHSTQAELIEQMSLGSHDALNATEYAIQRIMDDDQWLTNSQKGIAFEPVTIGGSTISSGVVDAGTGELPTARTSTYRVTVTSQQEAALFSASVDINATNVDYASYVKSLSALHYWPMNEEPKSASAEDAIDFYTGEYRDPAAPGASTNDDGGVVPVFTDSNDSVVVPWGSDFRTREGTFSMWVNCTGSDIWSEYAFLGMLYSENGVPSINMSIFGYGVCVDVNSSGVFTRLGGLVHTGYNSITPKAWHHITLTWGAAGVVVYIDGVNSASDSSNTDGLTCATGDLGKQPLHIGGGYSLLEFSTVAPEGGFEGSVAHVAFFNRQLTAEHVADLAAIKPDLQEFSIVEGSWARVAE